MSDCQYCNTITGCSSCAEKDQQLASLQKNWDELRHDYVENLSLVTDNAQLRMENLNLREALDAIANMGTGARGAAVYVGVDKLRAIARAALGKK